MKKKGKFGKFLLGSAAVAGIAVGAYQLYKNFKNNNYDDDFDDFDDDFDDDFFDDITVDEFEDSEEDESTREYVSLNINGSSDAQDTVEEDTIAEEDTDNDLDKVED